MNIICFKCDIEVNFDYKYCECATQEDVPRFSLCTVINVDIVVRRERNIFSIRIESEVSPMNTVNVLEKVHKQIELQQQQNDLKQTKKNICVPSSAFSLSSKK